MEPPLIPPSTPTSASSRNYSPARPPEDIDDSNPENVAELLKWLEAAEGLAGGVEERLDEIMNHLDTLLGDLETKQTDGAVKVAEVK